MILIHGKNKNDFDIGSIHLINFKNVITIWAVDNKKQDKKPLF